MKKALIGWILALCSIPTLALAQSSNSRSSSGAEAISSPTINTNPAASASLSLQQSSTVPEGAGRWFVPPAQPYSPPLYPYLGPWNSGANILDDLSLFPEALSKDQAERMYLGGVAVRVNKFDIYPYEFETCKLLAKLPKSYKRVAIITLYGSKEAGTADVIAKASLEAMKLGANGIFLIKKIAITGSASSGWGIGIGGVTSQMGGSGQTNSQTGSFGTGYNSAQAKPVYEESMSVLAIQE